MKDCENLKQCCFQGLEVRGQGQVQGLEDPRGQGLSSMTTTLISNHEIFVHSQEQVNQ